MNVISPTFLRREKEKEKEDEKEGKNSTVSTALDYLNLTSCYFERWKVSLGLWKLVSRSYHD